MERDENVRACPICSYPMKAIDTILFGLLFKCMNLSCPSKRYGNTARSPEEWKELGNLLEITKE